MCHTVWFCPLRLCCWVGQVHSSGLSALGILLQPLGMNRCQELLHSRSGANLPLKWCFPSVHPVWGNMGESKGEYIFIPMSLPSLRSGLQEGGESQPQSQAAPTELLTLPAWCLYLIRTLSEIKIIADIWGPGRKALGFSHLRLSLSSYCSIRRTDREAFLQAMDMGENAFRWWPLWRARVRHWCVFGRDPVCAVIMPSSLSLPQKEQGALPVVAGNGTRLVIYTHGFLCSFEKCLYHRQDYRSPFTVEETES